jgi:hypothetical protein
VSVASRGTTPNLFPTPDIHTKHRMEQIIHDRENVDISIQTSQLLSKHDSHLYYDPDYKESSFPFISANKPCLRVSREELCALAMIFGMNFPFGSALRSGFTIQCGCFRFISIGIDKPRIALAAATCTDIEATTARTFCWKWLFRTLC